MFTLLKRLMLAGVVLVAVLGIVAIVYMQQAKFGKAPAGQRLERMKRSPHYKNGKFENLHPTPALTEGYSMLGVTLEFLFQKTERRKPQGNIPSVKTDLLHLSPDEDVLVWFGHSSYFMQIDGKRVLVDPVFSGNAAPLPGSNRAFGGTDRYRVEDLPRIDYLLLTHDHYDHADYETLVQLQAKTETVVCGLGVGAHLEHWGFSAGQVLEKDWNEKADLDSGFAVYALPARHFSGRRLSRNNTLWLSFLLQTPTRKIYVGGDSGYDTHFAEAGSRFGPIDLAILENGQYDVKWKYIHMQPDEVLKAARDLKAKRLFPVHNSKFAMANHAWNEPLTRIAEYNRLVNLPLVTPLIGERVDLGNERQPFREWWKGLK